LAYGANALLNKLRDKSKIFYASGLVALILLPLLLTRVMFWGFSGQLSPRKYPDSWFAVNQQLDSDRTNFKAIILPWYQYMQFNFSDRIIANPAPNFFNKSVLASTDPEFKGATSGQQDKTHQNIQTILESGGNGTAQQLATQNIKYILLSKEDSQLNQSIKTMPRLKLLQNYPDLSLYQNLDWRKT
jgi:hypothetical protein